MKRILLATVALVTLLCILCSCGIVGGSKLTFTENGDEYTVTGRGDCEDVEIEVPAKYKGKAVTKVGNNAFAYNIMSSFYSGKDFEPITSITLPDTITSIGANAFANNTKLESVNIPDAVTTIGSAAFTGCASLKSITIPDGVTEIGDYTFNGCSSLTEITIPDSVTKIGLNAFAGCYSLKTIKLPDTITEISAHCFDGCSSLESFPVNEKTVTIGDYAFAKCSSLGEVTIPSTVITLGEYVFSEVGENVTVNVSYDSTAPVNWNEKWHGNMGGGKAMNTSEAYYANVVVPNLAKKTELEGKIQSCLDQYKSYADSIASIGKQIQTLQSSGYMSNETYRELNNQRRSYQEAQSRIMDQRSQYQEELAALPIDAQLNR